MNVVASRGGQGLTRLSTAANPGRGSGYYISVIYQPALAVWHSATLGGQPYAQPLRVVTALYRTTIHISHGQLKDLVTPLHNFKYFKSLTNNADTMFRDLDIGIG